MQIKSYQLKDGVSSVEYEHILGDDAVTVKATSMDPQGKALAKHWNMLPLVLANALGLGAAYAQTMEVRTVRFKEGDKSQFSITAIKAIDGCNRPFNVNSPLFDEDAAPGELVDVIKGIKAGAKAYLKGDSIQGLFTFMRAA